MYCHPPPPLLYSLDLRRDELDVAHGASASSINNFFQTVGNKSFYGSHRRFLAFLIVVRTLTFTSLCVLSLWLRSGGLSEF